VQAAINASRVDLPATLRSNPTYRKSNPADAPVMILALTSRDESPGQIYEAVSNVVSQRLAQVEGVGDVETRRRHAAGGAGRAAAVCAEPLRHQRGGRARRDPGSNATGPRACRGRRPHAADLHAARGGARRRLRADGGGLAQRRGGAPVDVAEVEDGVENTRRSASSTAARRDRARHAAARRQRDRDRGRRARAAAGAARAAAADVELEVASDRTHSIRASLREIEITLLISIALVVLVVGAFLRTLRATLIPASPRWCRCSAPSA
jgi:multidrug efflux pump